MKRNIFLITLTFFVILAGCESTVTTTPVTSETTDYDTDHISFSLFGETFAFSDNGILDAKKFYNLLDEYGWKVKKTDMGDVDPDMEDITGPHWVSFSSVNLPRCSITVFTDFGSLYGSEDYREYPVSAIQISGTCDLFPNFSCMGWFPWMDSDETAEVLGTTHLVHPQYPIGDVDMLYLEYPWLYPGDNTGKMLRLVYNVLEDGTEYVTVIMGKNITSAILPAF